jgi:hypothetical protein
MEDHKKTILQLFDLAESVREELAIRYDHDGVAFISNFIERQRDNFSPEDRIGLINALGAFVGQVWKIQCFRCTKPSQLSLK